MSSDVWMKARNGLAVNDIDRMLARAVPVALLALVVQGVFRLAGAPRGPGAAARRTASTPIDHVTPSPVPLAAMTARSQSVQTVVTRSGGSFVRSARLV